MGCLKKYLYIQIYRWDSSGIGIVLSMSFLKLKPICMKNYSRLMKWDTSHHTGWLVVLRVALGILLLTKGIYFISNIVQLQELLLQQKSMNLQISWLPFAIAWAHIFGGLFIVVGLFTRAFCLVQLPIITAALMLHVSTHSLSSFALAEIIAAFMLLTVFLLEGGGAISLDRYYYFRKSEDMMLGT
jgi:uncharacterized membrane protein YphA (DoxX/SURF4 family)